MRWLVRGTSKSKIREGSKLELLIVYTQSQLVKSYLGEFRPIINDPVQTPALEGKSRYYSFVLPPGRYIQTRDSYILKELYSLLPLPIPVQGTT